MYQDIKAKTILEINKDHEIAKKLNVNIHAFSATRGLITPKMNTYTKYEADMKKIDNKDRKFDLLIVELFMYPYPNINCSA